MWHANYSLCSVKVCNSSCKTNIMYNGQIFLVSIIGGRDTRLKEQAMAPTGVLLLIWTAWINTRIHSAYGQGK